jgi:hypothetical protein
MSTITDANPAGARRLRLLASADPVNHPQMFDF